MTIDELLKNFEKQGIDKSTIYKDMFVYYMASQIIVTIKKSDQFGVLDELMKCLVFLMSTEEDLKSVVDISIFKQTVN